MPGASKKGDRKKKIADTINKKRAEKYAARTPKASTGGARRGKALPFNPKKIEGTSSAHLRHIVERQLPGWRQAESILEKRHGMATAPSK